MKATAFVKRTLLTMNDDTFVLLRDTLYQNYVPFFALPQDKVTKTVLAEKLNDFFTLTLANVNKDREFWVVLWDIDFDDLVKHYLDELESVVKKYIAEAPKHGKNEAAPVLRSRKYYEEALRLRKMCESALKAKDDVACVRSLIDYTRILMCLYAAAIANGKEPITNFNFAIDALNVNDIVDALLNEPGALLRQKKFNTSYKYSKDTVAVTIAIILLYKIISDNTEGGLSHG